MFKNEEQEARWVEHFKKNPFNQPIPNMTYDFSNADSIPLLDIELITIYEVQWANNALKNNKAVNIDEILAELLKAGGDLVMELIRLLNMCWHKQCFPDNWQKRVIVKTSQEGNPRVYNNWKVITFLSVPGKVFSIVLLRLLQGTIDKMLWEEQTGCQGSK